MSGVAFDAMIIEMWVDIELKVSENSEKFCKLYCSDNSQCSYKVVHVNYLGNKALWRISINFAWALNKAFKNKTKWYTVHRLIPLKTIQKSNLIDVNISTYKHGPDLAQCLWLFDKWIVKIFKFLLEKLLTVKIWVFGICWKIYWNCKVNKLDLKVL